MKRFLMMMTGMMISVISFGQVYQIMPQYGYDVKRMNFDSTLHIPTICGTPSLKSNVTRKSAIAYDSCGGKFYVYNPSTAVWDTIAGGSGGSGANQNFEQVLATGNNITKFDTIKMNTITELNFVADSYDGQYSLFRIYNGNGGGTLSTNYKNGNFFDIEPTNFLTKLDNTEFIAQNHFWLTTPDFSLFDGQMNFFDQTTYFKNSIVPQNDPEFDAVHYLPFSNVGSDTLATTNDVRNNSSLQSVLTNGNVATTNAYFSDPNNQSTYIGNFCEINGVGFSSVYQTYPDNVNFEVYQSFVSPSYITTTYTSQVDDTTENIAISQNAISYSTRKYSGQNNNQQTIVEFINPSRKNISNNIKFPDSSGNIALSWNGIPANSKGDIEIPYFEINFVCQFNGTNDPTITNVYSDNGLVPLIYRNGVGSYELHVNDSNSNAYVFDYYKTNVDIANFNDGTDYHHGVYRMDLSSSSTLIFNTIRMNGSIRDSNGTTHITIKLYK
jgi:hypothetical protein